MSGTDEERYPQISQIPPTGILQICVIGEICGSVFDSLTRSNVDGQMPTDAFRVGPLQDLLEVLEILQNAV